ncbi:MAG: hypothetical protein ABI185_06805, partial [Ginsengibacter sp.]
MKTLLILFLFSALCGIQCKKTAPTGEVLAGKLIINGPCTHYVIQLQKGTIDTANIESTWYDSFNDSTYTNVFTVDNLCTFGNYGLQKGDVFTFQIDPNPPAQTC